MKILSITLALCISLILSANYFLNPQINDPETIVGTWVAEGSSFENRWIYSEDHTVDRYYKNEIYKTYNWTIRELSTPSGKTGHELILTNVEKPDDHQNFFIDTLTDERLILVYNTGIGLSRSTYFRQ